ncbi:hypothetical protein [Sphingomonas sp. Leaf231]|uniref:hypothetical protein n=1 Tax=Sphingomonas sp. Leaf231 TaxID=1736301 RepID=UPI00138F97A7|nr:hypothetical protein [Sphingomonas sp. Leaf231]
MQCIDSRQQRRSGFLAALRQSLLETMPLRLDRVRLGRAALFVELGAQPRHLCQQIIGQSAGGIVAPVWK